MTVYIALGLILLGIALLPLGLRLTGQQITVSEETLSTPLARELWRQSSTPTLGFGAASSPLLPIFGFETYPKAMRRIYDLTRELDAALLRALLSNAHGQTHLQQIQTLQRTTRFIRRHLMVIMTSEGGEPSSEDLEGMIHDLNGVERTIQRMVK